jgi:ABC-2 type transport system ATP-binding protein
MSIEVKNLVKIYGEQKAVNDISFRVNRGEIVGFLGPNGAGKSTTMKIVTGYITATAGEAYVCDINVTDDPLAAKRMVGYLPELNALYYDMFVREYLAFLAEVHQIQSPKNRIEEVIELTGLTHESRKRIGQLSKGYKQRVGLAAALIHDPEVLILDEPTSGLDPNQIIEIREVIRKQGINKTILFSSHILQEVEAICDRVIIIHKGKIVANDSLTNLRKGERDEYIVSVQFSNVVQPELLSALPSVTGVTSSNTTYQLHTTNPDTVRKQLLALAVEKNLNIVSLTSESRRLEDVFRSLTGLSADKGE